ncbi:MAG: hypothetical protein RR053_03920, partial [Evtepia sp.]
DNLSQNRSAWVSGDAQVFDSARVCGDARVSESALVSESAWVSGDAQVYGGACVSGKARVFGKARVCGDARVSDSAWVSDSARVSGDAEVSGDMWVSGDAKILSSNHYLTIGVIGSRDEYTAFYKNVDDGISVSCGCFSGTISEFEAAVRERHGDNKHARVYAAAIALAKLQLDG